MSYINVAITHVSNVDSTAAQGTTLRAGFSREGGRLETLELLSRAASETEPHVTSFPPSRELAGRASSLLDAVLGAGGLRNVTVTSGTDQPTMVTWSDRFGSLLGTSTLDEAPTGVQQVLTACDALTAALPAA